MTDGSDNAREQRELEQFLDAIERTPMTTGRGPGLRRTDLTPLGCAAQVLLFIGFFGAIFKPLICVPMIVLSIPLYLRADSLRRRKRLTYAEDVPAIEPPARADPSPEHVWKTRTFGLA